MAQAVTRGPVSGTAHVSKKRKPFLLDLYSTAVGKKYVMAITGLIGIGFVIGHLVGNLKVYLGLIDHNGERVYDIDVYGEFLRELLVPILPRTYALWVLRLVLIGALLLHLHAAYTLTIMNRRARPVKYQSKRDYVAADFAARTMRWTGIIVLLFLAFHLADLTWGWVNPDFVRGAVYRNLDASLSRSRWRSSTSSPTSPSASTCSTARGACSSRSGQQPAVQLVAPGARHRHRHDHRRRQLLVPHRRPGRHHPDLRSGMTDTLTRPDGTATAGGATLDAKIPDGPLIDKWDTFIADSKLVNPSNKRKFKIIVVGTGLAGASAAATLAELGYQVEAFTFHDSPRRAHSIAAQGGINAAKNYRGDGDSVHRLFYDTIKGGDFRSREGNVYRLAQVSGNIIDQMVAQGVPFAREYGGLLDNRSFGGAQVSRTFYARGQTGQQLLLGAYQQMAQQVGLGNIKLWNRMELVDVVVIDGKCAGIVTRDLLNGEVSSHSAHAVVLATGGYGNAFFLSTNAMNCNVTAAWRAHRKGAYFANPCYTQIHPTCIPQAGDDQSKLTLMSESLRNDGRVWVPKVAGDEREAAQIPEDERDYYLERLYPSFGNLAPRDISSRAAKRAVDSGRGVGPLKNGVNLDFADAIARLGEDASGSATGTCSRCTSGSPARTRTSTPMRIYPASHYTMGGLWVDYELMTTDPRPVLRRRGQLLRPRRQPPRRLGADAGVGRRVLRAAEHDQQPPRADAQQADPGHRPSRVQGRRERRQGPLRRLPRCGGTRSPDHFHRELGRIIWDYCGMDRNESGLEKALSEIPALYEEFQKDLRVTGSGENVNQTLEKAGRVDDFFQLGVLMCRDALERRESCGGHFRSEFQTEEGEALRDDENFAHVAAWEWTGDPMTSTCHKEELEYENVHFQTRSYK